jgi:hypothetical protein
MKRHFLWAPIMAVLLGSCSTSTPLPPHMKFDEAVSQYGTPTHVERLSDGGSIAVFQHKVDPTSISTYTLTFDSAGLCLEPKVETKTNGKAVVSAAGEDLDAITRLRNVCYAHAYDSHQETSGGVGSLIPKF